MINKKKPYTLAIFMMISCLAFAKEGGEKDSAWYEIAGTLVASLATIIGLAVTVSQIKISRPSNEKLKLEIESLKLDIEEKRLKLNKKGSPSVSEVSEHEHSGYSERDLSRSYTSTRMFSRFSIGLMAIMLPLILVIGSMLFGRNSPIQDSLGDYYYTNMRDIYVGTHLVIAVLLFSYLGYEKNDYVVTKIQGVFCLLVGFCPIGSNSILSLIHYIAFSLFLLSHSYFSIFLFTKTSGRLSRLKILRNKIYKICGFIILVCVILLFLYPTILFNVFPSVKTYKPIFYIESIAFWAFGLSWLLKDEFLLKDRTSVG